MKPFSYSALCLVLLCNIVPAAARPRPVDPALARAKQAVNKGIAYLHRIEEKDGSWGHYTGTTALALIALLRNGHTEASDPAIDRGIHFLLRFQQKNGSICDLRDPNLALPNYNTALSITALALTKNVLYRPVIVRGQKFLENLQFGVTDGMKPSNPLYGGIGYGSDPDDHPDLSNLATALEALRTTGVPSTAPVFKRAIFFIQRVQNREASNDQAWVKQGPNDGGFEYDPVGDTKAVSGAHTSTGSMTYSGIESFILCGANRKDPRVQSAWNWIRGHYTVQSNPNQGSRGLYYYYQIMAKSLAAYGQKAVFDSHGRKHLWQNDLAGKLASLQHPDGSWFNTNPRFWENQPSLVTAYTLISLSYCLHP